jgi:hypothetical protein
MRSRSVALAFLLCTSLLLVPSQGAEAQGGDSATLTTKMVLTALGSLEGSGNVQFRFDGAEAQSLREAVMSQYDANMNLYLENTEVARFLSDLGKDLSGRLYWGVSIQNPTNYTAMSASDLADRTSGLVGSVPSTDLPIVFDYDFDASGENTKKLLRLSELAMQTLIGSVERVASYTYDGLVEVRDRITVFGISSYTSPELTDGRLTEVRTPFVSILWYSFDAEVGPAESPPTETMTYEQFSVYENQQIAFVVLLIACMYILRIPAKRFEKYMLEHPMKFRKSAKHLNSVRGISWAMVALLTVLYLLPFLFSFADRNLVVYCSYLYFMAVGALVATFAASHVLYGSATLKIPDDVVVEVKQAYVGPEHGPGEVRCQICMMAMDSGVDLHQCACGFTMHSACARRSQTCPMCGEVLFPEHTRSVECRSCGETFLTSVEEDPYALQCTRCGAFQEEIKPGRNYLVVDVDGRRAYTMIRSMGLSGRPALVLTSEFPGKVREESNLGEDFEVKWLTEATDDIDSVDIKDLEGDVMETISTFMMTTKRSGLLLDGIETVVSENGFADSLALVKRMNDLAAVHGASVIMWMDRGRMPEEQARALSEEFDEVHDYL